MFRFYFYWLGLIALPLFSFAQSEATLLGTWDDPALIGSNAYDNTYNEIWGLSINDVEYAVLGSTAGTHFINISDDPANPEEEFFVEGKVNSGQIIHRDFHDYNGYLYAVADEGNSSLQIIDLRCLPESINVVYDSDDLIKRAHNIFIDDVTGRLYAFATRNGNNSSNAMRIYSLEDPEQPVFLAEHKVFGGETIGHVHDGWVDNNLALMNCGGDGFFIVDFTDPVNPVTLDILDTYEQQGYNHSGWPAADLQYYYMADENHGLDIKVVDISELDDVSVASTFNAGVSSSSSITHNQIVHCDYLYVSYYYDGLQVFDISDPIDPQRVLFYDTYSGADAFNFKGAWGVYPKLPSGKILLSDMQSGLYVFDGIDNSCDGREVTFAEGDVDCEAEQPTGLKDQSFFDVKIYPNPVQAGASIKLAINDHTIEMVNIYDVNGKLIQQTLQNDISNNTFEIDDRLLKGLYWIEGVMNNHTFQTTLLIQ